jgi:hypothetical protein
MQAHRGTVLGQGMLSSSYSHVVYNNPPGSGNPTANDAKSFGIALQFYPGIGYAINRRWQLETGLTNLFSIAYNHSKQSASYPNQPDQNSTDHNFSICSSLTGNNQFTVGVRYFIGG